MNISVRRYIAYMKFLTREEKIDESVEQFKLEGFVPEIPNPVKRKLISDYLGNNVDIIV